MPNTSPIDKQKAQDLLWNIERHTTAQEVEDALKAGADPNQEDEYGRTPLMGMLEELIGYSGPASQMIELLLDAGANPMKGDCALDRAMTGGCIGPIRQIASRAMRDNIRTDEGGTVVHVACRQLTGGEQATALLWILDYGQQELGLPHEEMVGSLDEDGNTPLHILWKEGVAIDRMGMMGEIEGDGFEGEEVSAQWYATALLLERGADLGARDTAGVSVLELIHEARKQGLPEPSADDVGELDLARLNAAIEGQQLNDRTIATHQGKRGVRL